jgi:GH24 family phage-related lysozyme (muramidase)
MTPRTFCVPSVSSWVEKHEGRHRCVYENEQGDKAVGVNYNLENDKAARKSELKTVLADYDKVIEGEQCLNDVQISALLLVDAKRKLNEVSEVVHKLDDLCCDIQAVLADLDWSMGQKGLGDSETFLKEIEKESWEDAATALRTTLWCVSHKDRCDADVARIEKGCSKGVVPEFVRMKLNPSK